MSNIVASVTAGAWVLLVGWIFPSAITVALFGFLVLPSLVHLPVLSDLSTLSATSQTLVLAFVAIALALVMFAAQTRLYRLLEGYSWPRPLRLAKIAKQVEEKRRLADEVSRTSGVEKALLLEKYGRYPVDDNQVVPTRLGNSIRAFETYAQNRYQLDSQLLWSELTASAPDSVRKDVDSAQAGVDFFVSLVYLFAALSVACIATGLAEGNDRLKLLVIGAITIALTPVWYYLAVAATDQWYVTIQALVNLGRKPLAEALGLQLPADLDREREMWWLVNYFVRKEFDPQIVPLLNEFRAEPTDGKPPDGKATDGEEVRTLARALEQLTARLDSGSPEPTKVEEQPTDTVPKG
jgi:hypothetical protein